MSLFTRLLWLMAIALLPTMAIQTWTSVRQHRERETALRAEALSQTRELQDDIFRAVGDMRQLLGALSQAPSIRAGDAAACTAYLQAVAAQDSGYALLAVNDAKGEILCNSAGMPKTRPSATATLIMVWRSSPSRSLSTIWPTRKKR